MPPFLYKYLPPECLGTVFGNAGFASFKCSTPAEFSDPYELFLSVDLDTDSELLAFHRDVVGELPQLPTTCFSRSPIVVPMWCHHAGNFRGAVIELDQARLAECFPHSRLEDVTYADRASDDLMNLLVRARELQKPRYSVMLGAAVLHAAYFTKLAVWQYERECRLVLRESETTKRDGHVLVDVPLSCVPAILLGSRIPSTSAQLLETAAAECGCDVFRLTIGRASSVPYFADSDGHSWVFDDSALVSAPYYCDSCRAPTPGTEAECAWCRLTQSDLRDAANRNPLRLFAELGLLERYLTQLGTPGGPGGPNVVEPFPPS